MKKNILAKLSPFHFLMLLIAGIINAIGVTLFIAPVQLYDSGISGTSILLSQLTPDYLSLSFFLILLNIPLLLFGFKRQGAVFSIYAIFTVCVYSVAAWLITDVLPIDVSIASPLAGTDLFLCALFGGIISGVGSGLAIRYGGAMDGIEVVAVIFAKPLGLSVGTFVLIYNVLLYMICGIVMGSWILPLYSIVTYAAGSKTVDFIVDGLDSAKAAMIITTHPDEIARAVSEEFGTQGLIWGIMAIGVYITYRILDVADLTVDGSLGTGGAVCVVLVLNGVPVGVALVAATLVGMLAGLVTGLFHTACGIPAILAGILTQLALYSVNLRIMGTGTGGGKANLPISVDKYSLLVSARYVRALALNNPIFVLLIFCAILIGVLYWFFGTELGCSLRATGANQHMARAQGINTNVTIVLGLMVSNGLVALAGGLLSQYQGFSDINMGRGAIVIGLAAVIIGEVIFGKIFRNFALKLTAAVIGAIIYYIVMNFVLRMGLSTDDLKLLTALVVAVFLTIPYWKGKYFTKVPVKKGGKDNA